MFNSFDVGMIGFRNLRLGQIEGLRRLLRRDSGNNTEKEQ